jgi:hypothetical protein
MANQVTCQVLAEKKRKKNRGFTGNGSQNAYEWLWMEDYSALQCNFASSTNLMEEARTCSGGHSSPPFKTSQIISLKRSNLGKGKKKKKK